MEEEVLESLPFEQHSESSVSSAYCNSDTESFSDESVELGGGDDVSIVEPDEKEDLSGIDEVSDRRSDPCSVQEAVYDITVDNTEEVPRAVEVRSTVTSATDARSVAASAFDSAIATALKELNGVAGEDSNSSAGRRESDACRAYNRISSIVGDSACDGNESVTGLCGSEVDEYETHESEVIGTNATERIAQSEDA
ncbi:hypothetical protein GN958_ATG01667 [Phytophthora infestans]|uniref:Uncharacterized protein n=1 Tax=Phytophthora infestans TaxID=4787 RepID=A0A8S9V6J3_PHYIN|nr:hypothetical protein GN958_ATG01667 [Phytophthora infestans]